LLIFDVFFEEVSYWFCSKNSLIANVKNLSVICGLKKTIYKKKHISSKEKKANR